MGTQPRTWLGRLAAGCLIASATLGLSVAVPALHVTSAAHADSGDRRIIELTAVLSESASPKERIGAVTALARLGDRRTLKPLVTALQDPSAMVRALAAAALGKLKHKASLPALKQAISDSDDTVRKRAREAYLKVAKANGIPSDLPGPAAPADTAITPIAMTGTTTRPGFGHAPRAVAPRPDLYVVIKSASDDSPGKADKRTRKAHADKLREVMLREMRKDTSITNTSSDASRYDLDARHLDLSVVKLEYRVNGGMIEVEAELRLAISDDTGRMLSFVSGGAMVTVAKRTFNQGYLPQLRAEALDNAVQGLFTKLVQQMRRGVHS